MMPEPLPTHDRSDRLRLAMIFAGALVVRLIAAIGVEKAAKAKNALCLFDDTLIYWKLAQAIRTAAPYVVNQSGVPHFALRTPGYPLFLAACQIVFGGENTLAPRLVQALLGALCAVLVYSLTRSVWPTSRRRATALFAAILAAFEPYWAATSALLLSEAVFVPLMLLMLWGLASLWRPTGGVFTRSTLGWAMMTGFSAGLAILVKPSWALAPPLFLIAWILATRSIRLPVIVALTVVVVMSPWWIRNARIFGRFVSTAVWSGASLYDGLNPQADGSSDMKFLERPEFVRLGEIEQDRTLREASLEFARSNPGRVAVLALVKAGRFWSPWPNAKEFSANKTNLASALVTLPIFALLAIGIYHNRRDVRALILLGGPLVYFFALHLLFVSSIRYRIPAMVPAFGLVSAGFEGLVHRKTD